MNLDNINIISAPRMGLSSEQIKQILEEYYQGKSAINLEQEWNLKPRTIDYFRKKMKLPKYIPVNLTEENIANAVNAHINGMLLKDVCNKYNISSATVYKYMKQHNIEYKNNHGRKNNFNEDYFESIDTEHKAYWLGFIYADGCVMNTGSGNTKINRLQINISNKDIELLIAFCKDINYDETKIQTYEPKGTYSTNLMSRLSINSVKLCSDLAKWGVHPNKTGKLNKLPKLSKELMPHFIRGFFDGDGWCTCTDKSHNVGFIGDYIFLKNINDYLVCKIKTSNRILHQEPRRENQIFYLRYSSMNDYKLLYKFLYSNCSICLERKRIKFETLSSK